MIGKLEDRDFDKWLSQSELAAREEAMRSNDAFVAALAAAARRGRENVKAGIYVDPTPPVGARRIFAASPVSACGSPAAMCLENAVHEIGAEVMK